jgi:hypothetical protein
MPAPRFLGYQALLGEPKPINWQGVGQALWDTNLNAPIRGVYNLMQADPYTLYTDEGAAGQQAATDSFDAAGGVTVGSMPMPKPSNSLTMGIKAYHGSPHSFDKFSMDKIGTGEGAQAYGHGLYFAENEGVAKGYRDTLTKSSTDGAQTRLKKAGGDVDAAIADLQGRIANYRDNGAPQYADAIEEDLRALVKFKETGEWTPGSMYEVNIDADPNAFLDWDKPLSEQPEAVQGFANSLKDKSFLARKRLEDVSTATGKDVWEKARNAFGVGQSDAATKALAEAGIPGIKYLDAGSRGAGDGTRNYVVFDDKLISIVKKYGIAGASAMLGYDVLTGANEAQAKAVNKAGTMRQ